MIQNQAMLNEVFLLTAEWHPPADIPPEPVPPELPPEIPDTEPDTPEEIPATPREPGTNLAGDQFIIFPG